MKFWRIEEEWVDYVPDKPIEKWHTHYDAVETMWDAIEREAAKERNGDAVIESVRRLRGGGFTDDDVVAVVNAGLAQVSYENFKLKLIRWRVVYAVGTWVVPWV